MAKLPVCVPDAAYEVCVERGLLDTMGQRLLSLGLRGLKAGAKVALITDGNVAGLHAEAAEAALARAGFAVVNVVIPAGEQHKTLHHVSAVYDQLLGAPVERSTPVIALGGGVIGDMAGFAAATVLRGLPLIQCPTTLLAMVDASVGGKTGVNHRVGKNLIGAFYQPRAVLIDPEVLRTLPAGELRSGLAECIKHDVIRDAEGFARLERDIHRAADLDIDYLQELVEHNVAIKAAVVAADPFERGERAHLNFGHTFGHAIENVSRYAFSHGQCVAFGMIAACHVACGLGMLTQEEADRVTKVIARAGLLTRGTRLDSEAVMAAMAYDKKVEASRVRLILPDRIGHVVIRDDAPAELLRAALESVRG